MNKKSFFLLTTVSMSLDFFKNQVSALSDYYQVTLISSPSNQLKEISERENVNFKGIEMKRDISLKNDLISLFNLFLFFVRRRPYIIHCNTPKAALLGLLAGRLAFVPKRIYYIHGLRYEGASGIKRKLLFYMEKISCACATNIIAVSNGVKEIATKELTKKKVDVIHNGSANGMIIDHFVPSLYDTEKIRKELNIGLNDFVYGFVGRIVGDKGINELVEAFHNQNNSKAKLILIGFYEENLDPVKNITKEIINNNPNIINFGFQKDVKKYLSIMDVFVSPSYREGFGLSLLEANLMKVPVIATKITGYSEIIEENKNGFFVPVKNVRVLEEKMSWIFENRLVLDNMKDTCRKIVIDKYKHSDVLREAIDYYKKL